MNARTMHANKIININDARFVESYFSNTTPEDIIDSKHQTRQFDTIHSRVAMKGSEPSPRRDKKGSTSPAKKVKN